MLFEVRQVNDVQMGKCVVQKSDMDILFLLPLPPFLLNHSQTQICREISETFI